MLLCANAALEENKQRINELNVFPVPDGDTGTNMSLTMNSAAIELGRKQTDTVGAVADCAASALLRGARGNSGVILSLLFRGIAKSLKGRENANAAEFAAAVSAGVDAAYKAVMKPAEGTILTVSRLGAQAAVEFAKESTDFEAMLEALLADEIARGSIALRRIRGLTLENRMACNQAVPDDVLAEILTCDVLLKGPTTTPMGGGLESANVKLRRALDLYANVRPVTIPDEGVDWTFFRENTEGEYALGSRGVELPGMAVDFKVTTDPGTRRIARAAFDYARRSGKTRVTVVTKANILKKTDGKFTAICHEVAADYPEITVDDYYIDIMAANLVNERVRSGFQVLLLPNLYGDIITDEAAQLQGGVGTAGSANIGDRHAMFEAIHGSAPRMIERGMGDYANPQSILRAEVMLLRHIGRAAAADRLEAALNACPVVITGQPDGATCADYGDGILKLL
ncbi:MAG: DAK2 domain-containing protein [Clostridiales bacterium]|nr:DAK2 domain-containing protein [Clostridiales bacterium]